MRESRDVLSIDRHLIDLLNIIADALAVLGLLYAAYDLCGRRYLKWLLRVLTPALIGAIVSIPIGILVYALLGFPQLIERGALIYGITGILVGVLNGLFISWPVPGKKPQIFSRRNAFFGGLLAFLGWSLASLSLGQSSLATLVETIVLALVGGGISGIWNFLNWKLASAPVQGSRFSWAGCLYGTLLAFALGFLSDFALGYGLSSTSLYQGLLLLPTGAILGAGWPVYRSLLSPLARAIEQFIHRMLRVIHFKKDEGEADKPNEGIEEKSEGGNVAALKPPLFSWQGCLCGLVAACLFGFIWAVTANVAFSLLVLGNASRQELAQSVGGALLSMSLIGPGGAIIGGFSRFIFWRADGLQDKQLAGLGAVIAALGLLLQFIPPLLDYLNFSIH